MSKALLNFFNIVSSRTLLFVAFFCFTAAYAAPTVTTPVPGSTFVNSIETFTWSANGTTGITQWWIYVGDTGVGSNNIYSQNQNTDTSTTVGNLPTDGSTVYFRLWYRTTFWQFVDFTYTACTGCASSAPIVQMVTPVPGSTFTQPSQVFTWEIVQGFVNQFWLYVGTTGVGSSNIYNANQGTSLSETVTGLPTTGVTVYVRLWYNTGSWQFIDYTYTSCTGCVASPIITLQKSSAILNDPVNVTNPKRIPGSTIEYTTVATNTGFGSADNNSVILNGKIPSDAEFVVNSVSFTDGSPASGLTATAANFSYSVDGIVYNSTQSTATTHIRVSPIGIFAPTTGAGSPSFEVKFNVTVK